MKMKKLIAFFALNTLFVCSLFSVAPQTMSYQAVVRDQEGKLIAEKSVSILVSILQNDSSNTIYQEEHATTTNANGLITLSIGKESSFSDIKWSDGTYYLQCQFDLNNDGVYDLKSYSPIQSVPYALYAERISPTALPAWVYNEEKPSYRYDELEDKPVIPLKLSELENDVNFLTQEDLPKQDSSFYNSIAYQISSKDCPKQSSIST